MCKVKIHLFELSAMFGFICTSADRPVVADVVNAVNVQNLTLPSGLAKIGDTQYTVRTNAMPVSIADLNDIPIKYTNGQTVFLKDVGQVHDGWAVQQNIVHNHGQRSVLLSVLKNGNARALAS
jgi:multidrug efflux pump subunit AcrB